MKVFDLDGKFVRDVELPGIGTAGGFGGKRTDTETFYTFTSFATPPSIYRYDLDDRREQAVPPAEGEVRPGRLRGEAGLLHEQGRHEGADVHRAQEGAQARRHQPDAALRLRRVQHLADAGLLASAGCSGWRWAACYAVANLRGGGEYGEDWHRAGTKLKKQNVFDDFIAAAEYLIEEKYTSARRSSRSRAAATAACSSARA